MCAVFPILACRLERVYVDDMLCVCSGDTASNLGSAVDELMRHQPTLKTDATTAIIKVVYLGLEAFLQVLEVLQKN